MNNLFKLIFWPPFLLYTIFIFLGVIFFYSPNHVYAANCGGEVVCACGDTVIEDYILQADMDCSVIGGNGLVVGANDIIVDGNNHTITGNNQNGNGINNNNGYDNITIQNFSEISNFLKGIYFLDVTSSTIDNVNLSDNYNGILIENSSLNNIINNIISNNQSGITIDNSSSNIITGNISNLNIISGIIISNSSLNNLEDNSMSNNGYNFLVASDILTNFNNTVSSTNTIEGKPIIYLYDIHGVEGSNKVYSGDLSDVDNNYEYIGEIGVFWCVSCSYVEVKDAVLSSNNPYGVYFKNTDNSTISNITAETVVNDAVFLDNSHSNNIINNNLNSSFSGINFYFSDSNTIINNSINSNNIGIYITSSDSNTFNGNTITNSDRGIGIFYSNLNNILENSFLNNYEGAYFNYSSQFNSITNNSFVSNSYAVAFYGTSTSNNITNNNIINNGHDIYDMETTNTYTDNKFKHNISNKMISSSNTDRVLNVGDTVIFDILMFDSHNNPCPDCTYSILTSPLESITTVKDDNNLRNSFLVNRSGVYSMIVSITDINGNTTKRNFLFFVGISNSDVVRYYLRGISPIHGQTRVGTGFDSKSLLFIPPTETEIWYCGEWVQNSPDTLPNYTLSNIDSINVYSNYKSNELIDEDILIGVQRNVTYDYSMDISTVVLPTESYLYINNDFSNLNWSMDYTRNWYSLSLKLYGSSPFWRTTPSEPSYADFTYKYTTTPAIKTISNDNINILSATASSADNTDASIVVENPLSETASTVITLSDMSKPFSNAVSTIYPNTTTDLSVEIEAESTITLDVKNMSVIPSTGSVQVSIDVWNTSDSYYKKWTEIGSTHDIDTEHTVGDLRPDTVYSVIIDGEVFDNYTSNSSGEITFTYNGGYSTKVFEIQKKVNSSSGYLVGFKPGNLIKLEENIDNNIPTKYIFNRDLKYKIIGDDVKKLQEYLNNNNFKLTEFGYGSPNNETTFFGLLTKNALIKFQKANNLRSDGIFGPITRGVVNK